ncbi:hypothetical protein [Pseudomonas helleri]|uniref:hypothetical protein n=1 Tax=Pseudomonas helleri TaxID=1608996 RepID=UPI003FD3F8DA
MSFVGDLAFNDQRSMEQEAAENPATTAPEVGFWEGSGTALFKGVGQGLAQLTLQAAQYGNDPSQIFTFDVESDEDNLARREHIGEMRNELAERMRPDAATSGTAAQVLYGLGDAGSRFAFGLASGGMPVAALTAGTSMGEQRFTELKGQGVDTKTAAIAGAIEGSVIGVGAILPAARLLSAPVADLAVTAGANVGLGIAARGGVGSVLEKNGYAQQAQQYKALDATGLAVDGLLGGLFWGAGRAMTRGVSAGEVDAALTANNGLHHQHGTAPGAPTDARSSTAHQNALDQAIAQLSRGEPVNVGELVDGATFIRSDRIGPEKQFLRQQAEQEVFSSARAELEPVAASGLPNVRDLRTELQEIKRSLEGLDATYRDTAKSFQRQGMSRKQAERATRDSIAEQRQAAELRSSEIEQSLAGNRAAELAGAELAQINRGEVPARLEPQIQQRTGELGDGFKRSALARGVSPDQGAALMKLAGKELDDLLRKAGHKAGEPTLRPPAEEAPTVTPVKTAEQAPAIDSASVARPDTAPRTEQADLAPAPAERLDSPEALADPLANIDQALPDLVGSIMSGERDLQIPTGLLNEDGTTATVSARELLQQADADIARAKNDSKGFLAAALCALRFGN